MFSELWFVLEIMKCATFVWNWCQALSLIQFMYFALWGFNHTLCAHTAPCAIMSYQGLLYSTCWNICIVVTHGHELQSNSQLYTWIGTWKVHSISDTLEVYCYLQCKPTTFSTWEMPFFITWMHPYLWILIWVAANSDFRIRKCHFNWKDLQTRDYILRYPYKTTNLLKDEMLFKQGIIVDEWL